MPFFEWQLAVESPLKQPMIAEAQPPGRTRLHIPIPPIIALEHRLVSLEFYEFLLPKLLLHFTFAFVLRDRDLSLYG